MTDPDAGRGVATALPGFVPFAFWAGLLIALNRAIWRFRKDAARA